MIDPHSLTDSKDDSPAPPAPVAPEIPAGRFTPDGSRVKLVVETPPGGCVTVEIEARAPDGSLVGRHTVVVGGGAAVPPVLGAGAQTAPASARSVARRIGAFLAAIPRLVEGRQAALVWVALAIYALTRLVGLDSFPIYFFTDEAVQTVLASDFVRDRLQNYDKEFLPAQFENGAQYNLGASVYLQVIPTVLLGKSIWVTRGVAALATLAAALSVYGIWKEALNLPHAWLPVLLLSATPAWFLHSRTAFETSLATTCYAAFLFFYLRYRLDHPRALYTAVAMGALTFYSYNPARVVMLATALALLVVDAPYHWRQRALLPSALGLALVLALPYARFLTHHPLETGWQMRLLGSYWLDPNLTALQKVGMYAGKYGSGLDPFYWYLPQTVDLPRHTMLGYGHLWVGLLPFGLLGVGQAVMRLRQPAYRVLLVAVLTAPAGAAMVDLGVTRALTMVIPMALLTGAAVLRAVEWAARRWKISSAGSVTAVLAALVLLNVWMPLDALRNGPTWYQDYGLAGMQWGARQLFSEVRRFLQENPGARLIVSPSWANGTDVVARFFFADPLPFQMGNADGYYSEERPLDERTVFVLAPEEFAAIPREKFAEVQVIKTMTYPNGQPAFTFVRLQYASNIRQILMEETVERLTPVEETVLLDGVPVLARFSRLDMGQIGEALDGDPGTLVRTDRINPLQLELAFPDRRRIRQVRLMVGGTPARILVQVWESEGQKPVTVSQELAQQPNPHETTLDLGGTYQAAKIRIEVHSIQDGPDAHVHLWDVVLEP